MNKSAELKKISLDIPNKLDLEIKNFQDCHNLSSKSKAIRLLLENSLEISKPIPENNGRIILDKFTTSQLRRLFLVLQTTPISATAQEYIDKEAVTLCKKIFQS